MTASHTWETVLSDAPKLRRMFDRRSLYFALFFVGVCVLLAGTGAWVALADKDYTYEYDRVEDDLPDNEGQLQYYDSLSDEQRADFRAARDGSVQRYERREAAPREVILKDGRYYVFTLEAHFDWLDPRTGGPTLTALLGLGIVVFAARRDYRLI